MPANLQEAFYDAAVDYRHGSPHLAHGQLHDRLVDVLRARIRGLHREGLPLRVLELGAGHGGFTEPALAAGCEVTAIDMSRPAITELRRRFGTNSRLRALYDPSGDLAEAEDGYSLILAVSVLHHVPDYESFVASAIKRLAPRGAFLSLQDPMWYPRNRGVHRWDRLSYYAWRVGQGDVARGLSTFGRRLRRRYDEAKPADMVEYHVVRQGVDEQAVHRLLAKHFESVVTLPYWSNQLGVAQRIGTRLGVANMFGIDAAGYRGAP